MKHLFTLALFFVIAFSASAQTGNNSLVSTTVVISQVYGGAGCTSAGCSFYQNDYIEIYNKSAAPVNISNWSVQYASATGTTWFVSKLKANFILQPGKYFLVGQTGNANGVNPIPTPDTTGPLSMSSSNGKVALVSDTFALTGACPTGARIIDLVGYGTATCFEGTAAAPTFGGNNNALFRAGQGCTDTDNNSADFTAAPAAPRTNATAASPCSTAPITLLYFNGQKTDRANALKWQVECTSTSVDFYVERSSDGRNFRSIYHEKASQARCLASFSFTDNQRLGGSNYYRLKIVDVDGSVAYSSIQLLVNGVKGNNVLNIQPNVISTTINLKYNSAVAEKVQWLITDMQGRVVKKITSNVTEGENNISVSASELQAGQYLLKGMTGSGVTAGAKFLKQ
jgi:hypothetical protein